MADISLLEAILANFWGNVAARPLPYALAAFFDGRYF